MRLYLYIITSDSMNIWHTESTLHNVYNNIAALKFSYVVAADELTVICLGFWMTWTAHHNHQQNNGRHHQLHRWRSRKELLSLLETWEGLTQLIVVTSYWVGSLWSWLADSSVYILRMLACARLRELEVAEHRRLFTKVTYGKQLCCFLCQVQYVEKATVSIEHENSQ